MGQGQSEPSPPEESSKTDAPIPETPLEELLPREGEILNYDVLKQLTSIIPRLRLFRRLTPLYVGGNDGFSMGLIEQKAFNWQAPSILLVSGSRLSSNPDGARERIFSNSLPPQRFLNNVSNDDVSKEVVFGTYLDVHWKHTYREAIGGRDSLLFQLRPYQDIFTASSINKEYVTFTKAGINFGSPLPRARAISGMDSYVDLGAVSLYLDESLEYGVFNHESIGGGSFHPSEKRKSDWQCRFEIESLEIWGCGGEEEAAKQKAAWAFEEREAAARKGVKRSNHIEADRALLEMAGLVGNHNASGGSMG